MNSESLKLLFKEYKCLMKTLSNYAAGSAMTEVTIIPEFEKLEGPQAFQSLPTEHGARYLRSYLETYVDELHQLFCSDESASRTMPEPVRPILSRIELCISVCILHDQWELALKALNVLRCVSHCSRRVYDEQASLASTVLLLVERGETARAAEKVASLPEETEPGCPDSKAFLIELARIVHLGFSQEPDTTAHEAVSVKLRLLETSYAVLFASKTPTALWSRGCLMLWQMRLRLRLGDDAMLSDSSLLDVAHLLRKMGYSLTKFNFGPAMDASSTEKEHTLLDGWKAVHMMMEACYFTCYLYTFLGVNREARCYLREFMKLGQHFYLPWRTKQCLTLMAQMDCMGDQPDFLTIRQDQLHYISSSTVDLRPPQDDPGSDDDSHDSNFIRSVPLPQDRPLDQLVNKAEMLSQPRKECSSPPLQPSTKKTKDRPRPDIYTSSGYRWLTNACRVIQDRVLDQAYSLSILDAPAKQPEDKLEENTPPGVCDDLISAIGDFKTPPRKTPLSSSLAAPRRHKDLDSSSPPPGKKAPVAQKKPGRCATTDSEDISRLLSTQLSLEEYGNGAGDSRVSLAQFLVSQDAAGSDRQKKVLVDTNHRPIKKSVNKGKPPATEEDDAIEHCPTAPLIPRNIRQRIQSSAARSIRSSRGDVTAPPPSTRPRRRVRQPKEKVVEEVEEPRGDALMDQQLTQRLQDDRKPVPTSTLGATALTTEDLIPQLERAYREMRWLPVPHLFRPLCQLLGLLSLERGDQVKAAFYLSQAVFIAFRVTYTTTVRQKARNSEKGTRWSSALESCLNCLKDIPSWRKEVSQLPSDWLTLQFTLVDELAVSGCRNTAHPGSCYLLVTKIRAGCDPDSRILHGFTETGRKFLDEFESVMIENIQSMSETNRQKWWTMRFHINDRLESLLTKMRKEWFSTDDLKWIFLDQNPESLVVLMLDRCLNNLPWEWLLLDHHPCMTRQPCLPVCLAHLSLLRPRLNDGVDLNQGYFVLNPDKNLTCTQDSLLPVLSTGGMNWTGVVGRRPNEKELFLGLGGHDVFTYCGHGSGCKYLQLHSLQSSTSRAVALLIGCSSCRFKTDGRYEPFAHFLSHLTAGSPCVLGLLWDVTDKDIDRYSMKLLSDWQNTPANKTRFSQLIRDARSACKMVGLVGKSPVVYGFPLDKTDMLTSI